ncbi:hypothetical protein RHMOL_Rhmol01G0147000 [Rhododendron molle]|uniref:Uncharacterized protein n=1 Tax=Rhododendron molle TaxID=49168 RepID=A0ACC0Q4J2_RHOML|nr:hypothetical protein RHMOL_Rhmol01G0147000 [Rhododendron molle]
MEATERARTKAELPRRTAVTVAKATKKAKQWVICGHGGTSDSVALYEVLLARVRQLVDKAGFSQFVWILTPVKNDHAVLVALAERWRDTTNTFHLPPREMTVTPTDFAAITGLRVTGGNGVVRAIQSVLEERANDRARGGANGEGIAIVPLRASLYPSRRSRVHLSYLCRH